MTDGVEHPLLRRLEHQFNPLSSEYKRRKLTKRINDYINRFVENPEEITKVAPLIQIRDQESIFPANTEENQAMLAGMFFALNRQQYPEASFLKDKEQRQIDAVAAFLSGFHLQMGTGEGKSTVVFPIVALVESLTNNKHSVVLATSDESNLNDLQENTLNLINQAAKYNLDLLGISFEKKDQKKDRLNLSLQKQMVIDGLTRTDNNYSEETQEKIKKSYWESILSESANQYDFIYGKKEDTKPRIILATDRDLVFSFAENREKFIAQAPEIYMDEADIPYNRRTPYKQTSPTLFFTPQELEDSSLQWLTNRLIWKQLKPSDFQPGEKGYELTEEAVERIKNIQLSKTIVDHPDSFNQAVSIMAKKLGLTDDQVTIARDKFLALIVDSGEYESIGRKLADFYKKSGVFYKSSKTQGGISVRDHYIDQILEDHHFTPNDQIAILAIEGKYEFVQLDQSAKTTLTFQTFINALRDKLHCASGTLKFPNSETKKVEETNFSRFLTDYTGRKVYDVTQPEIKNLPIPEILETDEKTIEKLTKGVESLKGKKPTLVLSYDINNSLKIFNRLSKTYGKRVKYIPTKPSNYQEVTEYNIKVKKFYQQLADGEIDVLVSSGASGFAVNIIKSDKSYPDLHIVLHNLPANRQLLMQNLSRRRRTGSEFSWYISEQYLELYMNMFEEKTDLFSHLLGKLDVLEVRKRLEEVKDKPQLALSLVLDILKQAEKFEAADDEFSIAYDQLVENINQKMDKVIKDKILEPEALKQILSHNIAPGKKTEFLKTYLSFIGLPSRLYEDLRNYLPLVLPTISDKDQQTRLEKAVTDEQIVSILDELINDWSKRRFSYVDDLMKTNYDSVVLLDHTPLYQPVLFKPLTIDTYDRKTRNRWGAIELQGKNYLGYRKPDNSLAVLTYFGRPIKPSEWMGFPYSHAVHGFEQNRSVVLVDFFNK